MITQNQWLITKIKKHQFLTLGLMFLYLLRKLFNLSLNSKENPKQLNRLSLAWLTQTSIFQVKCSLLPLIEINLETKVKDM
jgi:hypothetical protein